MPEPETHGVALPHPDQLGPDPEEPASEVEELDAPDRDAVIDYMKLMAERVVFLECALTSLVEDLLTRRILPSDAQDRIIEVAEGRLDALPDALRLNKGRDGLIAAFVDRNGD